MKLLFIGGHCDGQWKDVHKDQYQIEISEPISDKIDLKPTEITIKTNIYKKQSIRGEKNTFHIMVKYGIPTDVWIEKLISEYRKE